MCCVVFSLGHFHGGSGGKISPGSASDTGDLCKSTIPRAWIELFEQSVNMHLMCWFDGWLSELFHNLQFLIPGINLGLSSSYNRVPLVVLSVPLWKTPAPGGDCKEILVLLLMLNLQRLWCDMLAPKEFFRKHRIRSIRVEPNNRKSAGLTDESLGTAWYQLGVSGEGL